MLTITMTTCNNWMEVGSEHRDSDVGDESEHASAAAEQQEVAMADGGRRRVSIFGCSDV